VKYGVFDGPEILELVSDSTFTSSLNDLELQAWNSFKEVLVKLLGNTVKILSTNRL
jgi:hypothetical protein